MAPLLLKTLLGPSYAPPPATGKVFGDVAPGDFAADFIEDVANRGIAAGCSASPPLYCPGRDDARPDGGVRDLHVRAPVAPPRAPRSIPACPRVFGLAGQKRSGLV